MVHHINRATLRATLVERLETFDISDDDDPDLKAKILDPEVAGMLADVPAYTGPGVDD